MTVHLLALEPRLWRCDKCALEELKALPVNEQVWHRCPAVGMDWPMIEASSRARTVAVEREDYIGSEVGLRHDAAGRPVMAARVDRPDGSNDLTVFPGVAVGESHMRGA